MQSELRGPRGAACAVHGLAWPGPAPPTNLKSLPPSVGQWSSSMCSGGPLWPLWLPWCACACAWPRSSTSECVNADESSPGRQAHENCMHARMGRQAGTRVTRIIARPPSPEQSRAGRMHHPVEFALCTATPPPLSSQLFSIAPPLAAHHKPSPMRLHTWVTYMGNSMRHSASMMPAGCVASLSLHPPRGPHLLRLPRQRLRDAHAHAPKCRLAVDYR